MTPTEQARAVVEALEKVERSGYDGQRRRCPACLIPSTWRAHSEGCELYAALLAARALLLGLEREQGWRPIETAPKDAPVLAWFVDDVRHWLAEAERNGQGIAYWTGHNGGGWVSYRMGTPTHWRPLPAPPESPEEAK